MLTPRDIHEKDFSRVRKDGYSPDEVDDFLDEVIVDFDKLTRENKELQARIEALNSQIESYRGMENSLMHTMVTAHKAADDITEKAKRESDELMDRAQKEAASILNSAEVRARTKMENYEKETVSIESRILSMKNVLNEYKDTIIGYSNELVQVVEGLADPEKVTQMIEENPSMQQAQDDALAEGFEAEEPAVEE